ncbi:hypothetical protein STEG23_013931, partial [Scotinomys teguina]
MGRLSIARFGGDSAVDKLRVEESGGKFVLRCGLRVDNSGWQSLRLSSADGVYANAGTWVTELDNK